MAQTHRITQTSTDLLTNEEAAQYRRVATKTQERERDAGGGPPYVRQGRRILYRRSDIDAWLAQHTFRHRAAEMTGIFE